MVVRLILGLLMTVAALAVSGRRASWLYKLISSGQPDDNRKQQVGERLRAQVVEVFGQRKLLAWSVPGLAHLFTFWAFVILASVYLEAYGALFDPDFHIPLIGRWPLLGFLQDTIAVLALISLGVFAVIRIRNAPERVARASRGDGDRDAEGNLGVQRKSEPGVRASGRAVVRFASGPPPWRVAPGIGAFRGGGHRVDRCLPRLAEIRRWRVPWNRRAERSDCFRGSADRTALAGCAFGMVWQPRNRDDRGFGCRGGSGGRAAESGA
jgi:hypothetical protein